MIIKYPPPDPELTGLARLNLIYKVEPDEAGTRLDQFTATKTGLSRTKVRSLIGFGAVWLGGKVCRRLSRTLEAGDKVTFQAPAYGPVKFYEADPGRIVFEDEWLLAYDKEADLPCQQTPYDGYNNLYAALSRLKPGYLALHHRLDSPTSGIMVFARRREANKVLSRLFSQGPLTKTYLALTQGSPSEEAWETDLAVAKKKGGYHCPRDGSGKPARTRFKVLSRQPGRTLVEAVPVTGRTHQIRLHLQARGLPIIGDQTYGGPPASRLMLHALSLALTHPAKGEPLLLEAPIPEEFES